MLRPPLPATVAVQGVRGDPVKAMDVGEHVTVVVEAALTMEYVMLDEAVSPPASV